MIYISIYLAIYIYPFAIITVYIYTYIYLDERVVYSLSSSFHFSTFNYRWDLQVGGGPFDRTRGNKRNW